MHPRPKAEKPIIAFDTETTGLFRHKGARMFAFVECDREGETTVYREDHPGGAYDARLEELWSPEGARRWAKGCHHTKFDIGMTEKKLGRKLREDGHDVHETMALSHIFDNLHYSHALADIAWDKFGYPKDDDEAIKPYMNSELGLLACPEYKLTPYQIADGQRTMIVLRHYLPRVAAEGYEEIYQMERDLVWTTLSIEDRGVMISRSRTRKLQDWLQKETQQALDDYRALSGSSGTPMSNDVGDVLKGMGFALTEKTRTGHIATRKHMLVKLRDASQHPVFDAILKYRAYDRGGSVLEGYLEDADENGVVHPSIHNYAARTGRGACKHPNLYNVSKEIVLTNPFPIPARRIFIPKPGFVNFHLDFKAIQSRLLVHASQDPEAMKIMREGGDFHAAAADCFYGERFLSARGEVWKALRDAAKSGDLAKGFGVGLAKLCRILNLDAGEGHEGDRRFCERFPIYAKMSLKFVDQVRQQGFVETLLGRHLSVARSMPFKGTNYFAQGSEAEIIKRAQISVDAYLRKATSGEAGIILPIYDELIIEWPRARLKDAPACLREICALMVDFPECDVPLEIEVKISTRDWMHAEEYDLEAAA